MTDPLLTLSLAARILLGRVIAAGGTRECVATAAEAELVNRGFVRRVPGDSVAVTEGGRKAWGQT